MIKVLKLAGFVGVPALKALVDAKLKNIEKNNRYKDMGKDRWLPNIEKDSWNNNEYVVGYDIYGNPGYWPVQKKTGIKSHSLFADKFSIPLALRDKLTKGKF